MESCDLLGGSIARRADGLPEDDGQRARLDAHLAGCANCRAALESQRAVRDLLRARGYAPVSAGFDARLAARLDDASGWFGLVDWRAWTFGLAPVAAVLALAAYLTTATTGTPATGVTLDEWARTAAIASGTASSGLLQQDVSSESLLESMLAGPATNGSDSDVR